MRNFDNLKGVSSTLLNNASYFVGEDFFLYSKNERDNSQCKKQDMNSFADLETEFSKLLKEPLEISSSRKETLCQFDQIQAP